MKVEISAMVGQYIFNNQFLGAAVGRALICNISRDLRYKCSQHSHFKLSSFSEQFAKWLKMQK